MSYNATRCPHGAARPELPLNACRCYSKSGAGCRNVVARKVRVSARGDFRFRPFESRFRYRVDCCLRRGDARVGDGDYRQRTIDGADVVASGDDGDDGAVVACAVVDAGESGADEEKGRAAFAPRPRRPKVLIVSDASEPRSRRRNENAELKRDENSGRIAKRRHCDGKNAVDVVDETTSTRRG